MSTPSMRTLGSTCAVRSPPPAVRSTTKFSPDGETIAFVRDGNLHVVDVASSAVRALTADGSGTVQNGVAEFVAQEEMDRHTGYWWSPDGRCIAYTQIDEAPVPLVQRPAYHRDRIEVIEQRYPAAGEDNALVRVGVSVAPVTDWRLYDTHYTERYMGHPQENTAGYEDSSVLTHIKNLSGKLLLVHGMADDNVLFQHSVLLMDALQQASIPFEMMAYPGKRHGIAGKPVRVHLFEMILNHFRRWLAD